MIYLDSSALIKLLLEEPESAGLERWLSIRPDEPITSSELAKVEVIRAMRRLRADSLPAARDLLGPIDLIPLSTRLIEDAANLDGPLLRSLDALHLASALSIADELTAFVAYDRRLSEAASKAGLEPVQPGRRAGAQ